MNRHLYSALIIGLLALGSSFFWLSQNVWIWVPEAALYQKTEAGEFFVTQGTLRLRDGMLPQWVTVRGDPSRKKVYFGGAIFTQSDSMATLSLKNGAQLELGPNTLIELRPVASAGGWKRSRPVTQVFLRQGTVALKTKPSNFSDDANQETSDPMLQVAGQPPVNLAKQTEVSFSVEPTPIPSSVPSPAPSPVPSVEPSPIPSATPSAKPTVAPLVPKPKPAEVFKPAPLWGPKKLAITSSDPVNGLEQWVVTFEASPMAKSYELMVIRKGLKDQIIVSEENYFVVTLPPKTRAQFRLRLLPKDSARYTPSAWSQKQDLR